MINHNPSLCEVFIDLGRHSYVLKLHYIEFLTVDPSKYYTQHFFHVDCFMTSVRLVFSFYHFGRCKNLFFGFIFLLLYFKNLTYINQFYANISAFSLKHFLSFKVVYCQQFSLLKCSKLGLFSSIHVNLRNFG